MKVEDGSKRAAEPAIVAVLHHIGAIAAGEFQQLSRFANAEIRNTRDEVVGHLRTDIQL